MQPSMECILMALPWRDYAVGSLFDRKRPLGERHFRRPATAVAWRRVTAQSAVKFKLPFIITGEM